MNRALPIALLLIASTVIFSPTFAQEEASSPEEDRAVIRQTIEADLKDLPEVRVDHIDEVVQLSLDEHGFLQLRTTVQPTGKPVRIVVGNLPGPARLLVRGNGGAGAYAPDLLSFSHFKLDDPRTILQTTDVSVGPASLNISVMRETPGGGDYRVQLIQTGLYEGRERIRLYVQEHSDAPGFEAVDKTMPAETFEELKQKYPIEVAKYLVPIFRDLKQSEGIVEVDTSAAWQVLSDYYEPDPQVRAEVDRIVAQLDADDPQARSQAFEALVAMGRPAAMVLMKRDASELSAEQRNQVQNFLRTANPILTEQAEAMRQDPSFLLQAMEADDEDLRRAAWTELKKQTGRDIAFDPAAPADQRSQVIATLREQFTPAAATTAPAAPPTFESP